MERTTPTMVITIQKRLVCCQESRARKICKKAKKRKTRTSRMSQIPAPDVPPGTNPTEISAQSMKMIRARGSRRWMMVFRST